jgi:hypothetical protein
VRYETVRRHASRLAREAEHARLEADGAGERVFAPAPEIRFEDRDHRHRDAAKSGYAASRPALRCQCGPAAARYQPRA